MHSPQFAFIDDIVTTQQGPPKSQNGITFQLR